MARPLAWAALGITIAAVIAGAGHALSLIEPSLPTSLLKRVKDGELRALVSRGLVICFAPRLPGDSLPQSFTYSADGGYAAHGGRAPMRSRYEISDDALCDQTYRTCGRLFVSKAGDHYLARVFASGSETGDIAFRVVLAKAGAACRPDL